MSWRDLVRWTLTVALLVGVFYETGIWTTVVVSLLVIRTELEDLLEAQKDDREKFLRFIEKSAGGTD